MFTGAIIGGLASMIGYGAVRYIHEKAKKLQETKSVAVSAIVTDPTKIHRNYFDRLMELLGTSNDEIALTLVSRVVSFAISQKESSDKKTSLRSLVEESLQNILTERKFRSIQSHVESERNLDYLTFHITKYFITRNPLKDAEVNLVERKDVENTIIYNNMLASYASKNLTALDLQNKMSTRKQMRRTVQKKVLAFFESQKDTKNTIRKENILRQVGAVEIDIAWDFIRKNVIQIEQQYGVTIARRTNGYTGEEGNHSFYDCVFYATKDDSNPQLCYNARAKVRKDLQKCIVLKDSIMREQLSDSFDVVEETGKKVRRTNIALRQQLIDSGIVILTDRGYKFTCDYEFASTSIAATLIYGARKSGHTAWKNVDTDETLKKMLEKAQTAKIDQIIS